MSSVDILVPDLPESVVGTTVATWHKKPSGAVVRDEVLVEAKTDKVVLEVPTSASGILDAVLEDEDTTILSRQILGRLHEGDSAGKEISKKADTKASAPAQRQQASLEGQSNGALSPATRRLLAGHNLDAVAIRGTGVDDRLMREDVEEHLAKAPMAAEVKAPAAATTATPTPQLDYRSEKCVPMTRLHKRVAGRLLGAENSTAVLATFNEVSMKPVMDLHKQYGDAFEKRHGIRLGFVSFYVRAVAEALKRYPEVNASIDGDDIVYHSYFDVGMTVSTPYGLVTPVLRDVDLLGMADIEKNIKELAVKGHDGKLTIDDLTGGSFTIANGSVSGFLMSTPIVNPPQSAILGMHVIKDRPMAVNDKVEILPTVCLAFSHNRRLIDGRESVGFLMAIKELLGNPTHLLLGVWSVRV